MSYESKTLMRLLGRNLFILTQCVMALTYELNLGMENVIKHVKSVKLLNVILLNFKSVKNALKASSDFKSKQGSV